MEEREPRWHHYVPQFYLRRFGTQEKRIAVIDRRSGEVEVKPIKKVAAKQDFYTLIDATGKPRFDVEYALSRLEGDAALSMRRVARSWPPSNHDKRVLASFIAVQYTRGQQTRDLINETTDVMMKLMLTLGPKDDESIRRRLNEIGIENSDEYVDQMRWLMENPDKYRMEASKGQQIITTFDVAETLTPALTIMDWHILSVQPPVLTTSDNPVTLWRKPSDMDAFYGIGFMTADEIRLPLDPGRMIVLSPPGKSRSLSITVAASPWGWEVNKLTTARAHSHIFAHPDNPQITQSVKFAREYPPRGIEWGGLAKMVRPSESGGNTKSTKGKWWRRVLAKLSGRAI